MRRHKVATIVIAVVLFVATASATLGLALLAATNGPFTHAFSAQRGADVTVTANAARASNAELAATGHLAGVTALAGPFAEATAQVNFQGQPWGQLQLAGRPAPGGPVDDLVLNAGHWVDGPGQVVLNGYEGNGGISRREHRAGDERARQADPHRGGLRQLDHQHRRRLGRPRRDRGAAHARRRPPRSFSTSSPRPGATRRSGPT